MRKPNARIAVDLFAIVGSVLLWVGVGCIWWQGGLVVAGLTLLAAAVHMD